MPALSTLPDASIYKNAQAPQSTSLQDLVTLGRSSLALQKERELYQPSVEKAKAETASAETSAESSKAKLQKDYFGIAADEANGLVNDKRLMNVNPSDHKSVVAAGEALVNATDRMIKQGVPAPLAHTFTAKYFQMLNDPKQAQNVRQEMLNSMQARIGASGQQGLQTPQYTTNAAGQIIAVQPGTNTIFAPNEAGQPQGGVPVQSGTPSSAAPVNQPVISRPTLNPGTAQAGMINTAAQNLSTDFAETQKIANNSEGRVALFQNIKKLAPESFTGVGGARKELATGILNAIGINAYEAEKMSTDELAKSSAMLALAGGNTDMARQMAEAANPNKKMNEGAIKQIADQMIGMERMNQAKYRYLSPAQTNPQDYATRLANFNKVNDFRIFQESSPAEVAKLKASMSPAEQKIMSDKIKLARQLGIL